jgi:hypothetical protein
MIVNITHKTDGRIWVNYSQFFFSSMRISSFSFQKFYIHYLEIFTYSRRYTALLEFSYWLRRSGNQNLLLSLWKKCWELGFTNEMGFQKLTHFDNSVYLANNGKNRVIPCCLRGLFSVNSSQECSSTLLFSQQVLHLLLKQNHGSFIYSCAPERIPTMSHSVVSFCVVM